LGECDLTCLMLRRSELDLSDNKLTSLAGVIFPASLS
jgi:hypothetical protein